MSADPRIARLIAMAERLSAALSADVAALEQGRPREMKSLDPEIQKLTAVYGREAATLNHAAIDAAPAEERARLFAATKRFRDVLSLHGRVLTRIRNASEGLIKAVAVEVERHVSRARPYVPPAYAAKHASPRPAAAMLYNRVV